MRTRKLKSTVGKIVMALVFVSILGSIVPAFGRDYNGRQGNYDRGHDRGRRGWHQPPRHYYPAPVYAPPPVFYAPAPYQSPGISLVFPIHIR